MSQLEHWSSLVIQFRACTGKGEVSYRFEGAIRVHSIMLCCVDVFISPHEFRLPSLMSPVLYTMTLSTHHLLPFHCIVSQSLLRCGKNVFLFLFSSDSFSRQGDLATAFTSSVGLSHRKIHGKTEGCPDPRSASDITKSHPTFHR